MRKTLTAVVAASLLILTACGNDDAAAGGDHNDADVAFAQQMVPHHEQAIEMAELAGTRAASQEVKDLAADIEAAQDPEIELMTDWLEEWGEDVPAEEMPGMDHGSMSSDDMPGMMSEADLAGLESASGRQFDRIFLTMMIQHHQGAVEMAKVEQADGEYADAIALAEDIESAQTDEIAQMQDLLAR